MDFSTFPKNFDELSVEQKKQVEQAYMEDVSTNEGKLKLIEAVIKNILTFGPMEPYTTALKELVKLNVVTEEDAKSIFSRGEMNHFFQRYFLTIISDEVESNRKLGMVMWFKRMMKRNWDFEKLWCNAPDAVGMSFIWIHEFYDKDNSYEIPLGLKMHRCRALLQRVLLSRDVSKKGLNPEEFDKLKDNFIGLTPLSENES